MLVGLLMRAFGRLNPPGPSNRLGRLVDSVILKPIFLGLAKIFLASGVSGAQYFREVWCDGLPMDNRVDYFWTPTEFSEMWVPMDKMHDAMVALRDHYQTSDISEVGTYCIEIYATPRSPFWLSPAYGRDVVKFDIFWFAKNKGDPAQVFFPQYWEIMMQFDCRFHWGKYMPVNPTYMKARYPRWNDFMNLRQTMDPNQIFVTDYWRDRLGIPRQEAGNIA